MSHQSDLLTIVHRLDLPVAEFVLIGSAGLMIRNIRRARDLDIFCTTDLWFRLLETDEWEVFRTDPYDPIRRCDPPYLYRTINEIEVNVFSSWRTRDQGNVNVTELISEAEFICGIPCMPLTTLLEWKNEIKRPKDIKDIEILKELV